MQILICADAQPQIGTGHLRRMLTLADALIDQGARITLQTSALGGKIAQNAGLDVTLITSYCTLQNVQNTLRCGQFTAVILDNYHWHADTETKLRTHVPFVAVVDDLADRPHDANLLLDQNAHHTTADYDGLVPDHCLRLVGGRYCLLAAPFRTILNTPKTIDAPIFVSLGGGDPKNDLVPIVETLLDATKLPLTIATGSYIADAVILKELANAHHTRIELIFDSPRVAAQMQASQFAVAAGGTMTWERAALGLPSLCLIVADNQAESAAWLADRDIHTSFDLRTGWSHTDFVCAVQKFATDSTRQKLHAEKSFALIAQDGAVQAARALLNSINKSALA